MKCVANKMKCIFSVSDLFITNLFLPQEHQINSCSKVFIKPSNFVIQMVLKKLFARSYKCALFTTIMKAWCSSKGYDFFFI